MSPIVSTEVEIAFSEATDFEWVIHFYGVFGHYYAFLLICACKSPVFYFHPAIACVDFFNWFGGEKQAYVKGSGRDFFCGGFEEDVAEAFFSVFG